MTSCGLVTHATLQYNGLEKHGLPNVDKVKAGDLGFARVRGSGKTGQNWLAAEDNTEQYTPN